MTDTDTNREQESRAEFRHERPPDVPISVAVVEAVAAVTGRDPTEIDHLGEHVNPDALNALFDGPGGDQTEGTVTFPLEGHLVVVRGNGEIAVRPRD